MTPHLEYFLVCRDILTDLFFTDEITLGHVLDDLFPDSFPYTIVQAVAISVWNIEAKDTGMDFQATVVVRVPGQKDESFPMNLAKGRSRYRAIQCILNIPVVRPGDVVFEVLLNGNHHASHTIRVHPLDEGPMKSGITAPPST